jgi:hypothetical protein
MVFLSAIVTKATVNKTGIVTDNTSRTEITVGKYNMFKLKENDNKIAYNYSIF